MRPGESDELLSAYLDREVTPTEREQVESTLDASPDTRAELDALAELSLCLRTFDRPEAPPELKASVMQALVGRRLEIVTPPLVKPVVRRSRREWIVTITAVVTTACSLFLAISSWQPAHIVGTPTSFAVRSSESGHSTLPVRFDDSRGLRNPGPHVEALDGISSGTVPMYVTMEANGDLQPPRPTAAMSAPKDADGAVALRNATDEARPMSSAEHSGLDKVALNDFLNTWAATDAPERYVANIDLQVLDVRKAVDGFHVLLHKNGVEQLPVDEVARAKQAEAGKLIAADAPAATPLAEWSDEGMVAVYVDTTTDRVAKSLEELLSQRYDVVGYRLQQPLALARSIEDDVVGAAGKEAKTSEKSQSRATTLDDVTREYVVLQQQMANTSEQAETDGPADARVPSNATNSENQQVDGNNQLAGKSIAAPDRAAAEIPALRTMKSTGDNLREGLADSNARALGMNLNYCSEVRLPLVNNFELATNNELATNGPAIVDPKTGRMSLQNTVTNNFARNTPQQNQLFNYNSSGNVAHRYRQANGRDSAPSVRVLVVFQDIPVPAKAKVDRGRP